jgi:DHA1 family tetracycline resistance protein-like MFS transporter
VALLALSGMFSSTFTLTFAYISDVVKDRDGRVAAYGLALATFGLSFTIGPLLGGCKWGALFACFLFILMT